MYCRGNATRVKIIERYKLVPLGRFKLLNGQSVISDAGNRDIIDEYTVFECIEINNPDHHETIYCGKSVAEDFCALASISLPPLFNPLKTISVEHSSHGDNSSHKNSWNKTRKQLYNCTLLLIMYFGNSPTNKALFSIKRELENPDYLDYFPKKQIKSINTYLSKTGITFQFVLNEMRKNNKIREFKYDLLIEYSNKLGITQHFC